MKRLFTLFQKPPEVFQSVRWLIIGLGNPGRKYEHTRHNAGFQLLNTLAERYSTFRFKEKQGNALLARGVLAGVEVGLVKPQTFMNRSGEAVSSIARLCDVPPGKIIVAYDDIDIPVAALKLRPRGRSGGHKGMRSIIQCLRAEDFPRIRLGIGRPVDKEPVERYVLKRFEEHEWALMQEAYAKATEAVETILTDGIEIAMNRYNVKRKPDG